jgi:hypothetical protein
MAGWRGAGRNVWHINLNQVWHIILSLGTIYSLCKKETLMFLKKMSLFGIVFLLHKRSGTQAIGKRFKKNVSTKNVKQLR